MKKLNNLRGFTLADVLITIGIIGVIAAITIPTLVGNQEMTISKNKFKKTISILNQAGKLAKTKYGYDYSDLNRGCNSSNPPYDDPNTSTSFCGFFNGTIKGHRYLGWSSYIKKIKIIIHM